MARQRSCTAYGWKAHLNSHRMGGESGYIMRAFAKALQISSPSATTTKSSLYETWSLCHWTSHRSGSRPHSAWPNSSLLCSPQRLQQLVHGFPAAIGDFLFRKLLYKSKFLRRCCKCCTIFVTAAFLPPPTLKQRSPGRNVTTVVTWVSPLCVRT